VKTRFDAGEAKRAVEFFEKLLVHTKGRWARHPFVLSAFQHDIIDPLFGQQMWDEDSDSWVRLYNLAWLEMARKNGKSELMAGIALKLAGADDEEGAEVYGVARDVDQAGLVFSVARRMLELAGLGGPPKAGLPFVIYPTNKRIVYTKLGSFYRVIPGDALGNLGQDPHGILFDEVISQPNGQLWDALKTGFGSRRQPMMVAATTAGDDPTGFAQSEHDFCMRVAQDPDLAPRRLVYIRGCERTDDPGDEEAWRKANPALGDFLRLQVLRDEYHEAFGPAGNIRQQRSFRQFRMNQWQEASIDSPIPLEDWDLSAGMVDEEKLKGMRCYGGVVTATIDDLTAICWTFPPLPGTKRSEYQNLWRFFVPEDGLHSLETRTDGKASQWVKEGRLKVTPGSAIDIQEHVRVLRRDIDTFDVGELAFDPNGAIGVVQPIMEDRSTEVVKISAGMSGSVLMDWARLVAERKYFHSANPVMRWQMACLMARQGSDEVLKIDRMNSRDRVPGAIAAEIALRRAIIAEPRRESIYNTRGVMQV
jgi:phage terminase large subunit-like protein